VQALLPSVKRSRSAVTKASGLHELCLRLQFKGRVPDRPGHALQLLLPPGRSAAAGPSRGQHSSQQGALQVVVAQEQGMLQRQHANGLQPLTIRHLPPSIDFGAMDLVPVAGSHPTHHMHMVHPLLEQLGQVVVWNVLNKT
jgi:hypothetical protein